ncbi:peptidyl-alpha-hydroxyglycine alpha-amidating lyase family protein [Paraburkholderia sp. ZP32-5]|uniref:peptidyl-alpha-hydroxyglycine alpha-amidating lyase family protein n=1 Tax=Paraburkholderia sp. ZP32-5 TaxID=2883245 RepID=UPI001F3CA283|nr:peptidyl-alpha-hydroxyglycine alpha-amidating lyase family protein [Paraburkholderia sp. ZP32-5]
MATIVGGGEFTYETVDGWAKLPTDWEMGEVAAVGVDRHDNVYVFNRGMHPMIVFDRNGNFLRSWGEGVYVRPHGVHMGPDDTIYLTDDGGSAVYKCDLHGKTLMTVGLPGKPTEFMSGQPFNHCTHTALAPNGDIFVSDGYGNARIHKYTPDGKLIKSWGEPGCEPGQFNLPHNISCDEDGWLYVADRENHRIQIFDSDGRFETQWHNLHRPNGMYMPRGKCPLCYVGETGPMYGFNRGAPNLGPRLSILSNKGEVLIRIQSTPSAGTNPGQFLSVHGVAVDSYGDIYVGETSYTSWPLLFPDKPMPARLRSLQKFARIAPQTEAPARR